MLAVVGIAAGLIADDPPVSRADYWNHRWVSFAAYLIAATFSFYRVPARAHSPFDVLPGAALGYAITRYDMFREER